MFPAVIDCHNHTNRSHDSRCNPADLCETAIKMGLSGVAITNHCDVHLSKVMDVYSPLAESHRDVLSLRKKYGDKFLILSGIEIGEGIWFPEQTKKLYDLADWDVVLGSAHILRLKNPPVPYSIENMTDWTEEQIHETLRVYFEDLCETLCTMDFDILAHLTCPMRYIAGKYGHNVDLSPYDEIIEKILQGVIDKGLSLEVNTSCKGSAYDQCMPDKVYLEKYYAMGGRDITIGSDSHWYENVGKAFPEAIALIKSIGFDHLCYYVKRQKFKHSL